MLLSRGVPIVPVAIQTPVGLVTADGVGPADGRLGVELGVTTPGRLGLASRLKSWTGSRWRRRSAPTAAALASTAATRSAAAMRRVRRRVIGSALLRAPMTEGSARCWVVASAASRIRSRSPG